MQASLMTVDRGGTAIVEREPECCTSNCEPARSVLRDAWDEACRHKWIESEKRGYDVGSQALNDWYHEHFAMFCRLRKLQHARGSQQYLEFGTNAFGRLLDMLTIRDSLIPAVVDRLEAGWENLDLIVWAGQWNLPMDRVIGILELIDINAARLEPVWHN